MFPLVVIASLIFAAFVIVIIDRGDRSAFQERFPPISDDEFVARCGPGTNREIALKVRRIVSDQCGVEYERIYPSSRLIDDLGAD